MGQIDQAGTVGGPMAVEANPHLATLSRLMPRKLPRFANFAPAAFLCGWLNGPGYRRHGWLHPTAIAAPSPFLLATGVGSPCLPSYRPEPVRRRLCNDPCESQHREPDGVRTRVALAIARPAHGNSVRRCRR